MTPRFSSSLALVVVLLATGLALFALGCDGTDTETTVATGSSAASTTTVDSTGPATSGEAGSPSSTAGTGSYVSEWTTTTAPEGKSGVVEIRGLVDDPKTLDVDDVKGMSVVTITVDGASGAQEYRGVRLSDLFKTVKIQSAATRVAMTAHADGYVVDLSLQDIQWSPDALLVINDDGTLSVVIPGLDRRAWVEDIISLEFK